jgi:MFS family permease
LNTEMGVAEQNTQAGGAGENAQKGVAGQLNEETFDALKAVGGVRGAIESVAPALVFVVVYVITMELRPTLIAAVAVSVVLILARLIARQPVTYSVSGFIGVGIGVLWALFTGRGEDFFAVGIITGAVYGLGILISILVRFPVVSMALTPVWQLPWKWWRHPQPPLARLARAARHLSWLWFGLFALRVGVQVPLWIAGNVAVLGTMKLILGLPPFLLVAWLTWVILRPYKPIVDDYLASMPSDEASELAQASEDTTEPVDSE